MVDREGGSSERCLKWDGGGSLRDLSKNILKQGVGKVLSNCYSRFRKGSNICHCNLVM